MTVALSLTPVLLFAGIRAYTDSQVAFQERREDLLIQSERAIDLVEQSLVSAEVILSLYAEDIAVGECARVQERIGAQLPFIVNTVHFDVNGTATCSALGADGFQIHNARWLTRLREGERRLRTDAFPGQASDEWLFGALERVDDSEGNFAGFSSFGISIEQLVDLVPSAQRAEGIEIALLDSDGTVFGGDRFADVRLLTIARVQKTDDGILDIVEGENGQRYDRVIRSVGGENIFAMISRPAPGMMSEFTLKPATTIGVPVVTFLLALAAVWLAIERSMLRWFWPLRRMTAAYAVGKYDYEPHKSFDAAPREITRLAATLESMARQVGARDEELREALEVRDASVKEVYHRVKNNLQIVSSFVRLQMRSLEDPTAREVLGTVRNRIDALSIVHQTLYQHERLEVVLMQPFLEGLLDHLKGALGIEELGGRLVWEVAEVERSSDDAIPMALFILEAVTNAVKYALETGGEEITVKLAEEDTALILSIQDDGPGGEMGSGAGLGSKLMQAFARQLSGELSYVSGDHGFRTELRMSKTECSTSGTSN